VSVDAWTQFDPTACPVCGRDSCEEHLPHEQASPSKKPRLTARRALDVMEDAPPVEIIEGVAAAGDVTVLASESSAGKTFVVLGMAAAASAGARWHNRATQQGSVVYIPFEGSINRRLRALHEIKGERLEHVYVIRGREPLSPRVTRDGEERSLGELLVAEALDALVQDLKAADRPPIRLVVIDTVRASLAGSEDNSENVSGYLRAVRRLIEPIPTTAALLVHHAGWQDGEQQRKRERGSSAFRGNVEATLYLEAGEYDPERGEAALTLRALKTREDELPPPLHLIRRRVELAEIDRHGQPVTSCVIETDCRSHKDRIAERLAAVSAADREIDVAVLTTMRDYPEATNIKALRGYVGKSCDAVNAAVSRLLLARLATPGARGKPYVVTEAGLAVLSEAES
jgi:RecA-family ATPase